MLEINFPHWRDLLFIMDVRNRLSLLSWSYGLVKLLWRYSFLRALTGCKNIVRLHLSVSLICMSPDAGRNQVAWWWKCRQQNIFYRICGTCLEWTYVAESLQATFIELIKHIINILAYKCLFSRSWDVCPEVGFHYNLAAKL